MQLNIGNIKTDLNLNKNKLIKNGFHSNMKIGGTIKWNYNNGTWLEKKITPDKWTIDFRSMKTRSHFTPTNIGTKIGSGSHFYIVADQHTYKASPTSYDTIMRGHKFKVGYRRPNWRNWSYEQSEHDSYKNQIIDILEGILRKLKEQ